MKYREQTIISSIIKSLIEVVV